ncbi:MAG: hypothetical protein PHS34_09240 [Candidatus Omnitrophica bacterium]|jgi:hypothetical protein|nr:hypothetical protein [Candidatus Omnitrophota bacterium]
MKEKLEIKTEIENDNRRIQVAMGWFWNGHPLFRKAVMTLAYIVKEMKKEWVQEENEITGEIENVLREVPVIERYYTKDEQKNIIENLKDQLRGWFDRFVVDIDELTAKQKVRLQKNQPIADINKNIAIVKPIKLRERIPSTKRYAYENIDKYVIVKLATQSK